MSAPCLSPLTFSDKVTLISEIPGSEITGIYSKYLDMDVKRYFRELETVKILKCEDTGYMFYYPFSTEGDEDYYRQMCKFDWYYNPSRWEHSKALELIKQGSVLEVGAGPGYFIQALAEKKINATGLELNGKAIEEAMSRGISLKKEFVQEHAQEHKNFYDTVCSFQVLEHISQPYEFLKAKIDCLKKGGRLLIGVPNNDSYMKDNIMYNKVLNMPPHHMGLWTYESLKSLEKLFPVKLKEVYYEPLVGGNVDVYMWNRVSRFFFGSTFFTKVIWKLHLHELIRYFLNKKAHKIRGNSMLAVFEKN